MISSGIYQLLIRLSGTRHIRVGKLDRIEFRKGYYIYTGSARKNLFQRLRRHFQSEKKLFWHIDYLLKYGEIVAFYYEKYAPNLECGLNRQTHARLTGASFIPGFGCSDCECDSHLIYIPDCTNLCL